MQNYCKQKMIGAHARMKPIEPKTLTQGGNSKGPVKFDELRYYQERKLAEQ